MKNPIASFRFLARFFQRQGATHRVRLAALANTEIADNGIGMSEQLLASIFQPFSRGEPGAKASVGGGGLDLAISARLVELLGGRISVNSILGMGSEFAVEIPLVRAESTGTCSERYASR